MSARGVDPSKLEAIKQGKKIKSEKDATENKKVTVTKSGDKIIAVEKEKKFEEAGVTKKKRNYVMYESKLGTEKETDLTQIKAPPKPVKPKKLEPKPRVEEKVIMTRKKVEYLDNFQYRETKEFRKIEKGSKVVHTRLSDPIGGTYEETSYQKITTTTGAGGDKNGALKSGKKTTTTTTTKTEQTTGNVRSKSRGAGNTGAGASESTATATKTMTSTTKVGRRGGAGGPTSTTTETTSETKTTRTTRRAK